MTEGAAGISNVLGELLTRLIMKLIVINSHPSPVTVHIKLEVLNFRHGFSCMSEYNDDKPNLSNFHAIQHNVLPPIDG